MKKKIMSWKKNFLKGNLELMSFSPIFAFYKVAGDIQSDKQENDIIFLKVIFAFFFACNVSLRRNFFFVTLGVILWSTYR